MADPPPHTHQHTIVQPILDAHKIVTPLPARHQCSNPACTLNTVQPTPTFAPVVHNHNHAMINPAPVVHHVPAPVVHNHAAFAAPVVHHVPAPVVHHPVAMARVPTPINTVHVQHEHVTPTVTAVAPQEDLVFKAKLKDVVSAHDAILNREATNMGQIAALKKEHENCMCDAQLAAQQVLAAERENHRIMMEAKDRQMIDLTTAHTNELRIRDESIAHLNQELANQVNLYQQLQAKILGFAQMKTMIEQLDAANKALIQERTELINNHSLSMANKQRELDAMTAKYAEACQYKPQLDTELQHCESLTASNAALVVDLNRVRGDYAQIVAEHNQCSAAIAGRDARLAQFDKIIIALKNARQAVSLQGGTVQFEVLENHIRSLINTPIGNAPAAVTQCTTELDSIHNQYNILIKMRDDVNFAMTNMCAILDQQGIAHQAL